MNLRIRFAIACLLASGVFGLFAMPVADELAAVKPLVSELMKPDMDALKAGKKSRADVAKSALSLATQAESSAAKLLLTRNAFNLYMKAGEYEPAEGALDAMLKAVPDYPADELQELLEKALYPVPNKKAPQLRARLAEVKTKAASAVQVKKLKALLEKTPEDPALNLRLGTAYALQNDWNNARSAFAKCSNADLAKAAKAELDLENPPAKVADLWWSVELPKKDPKLTASIRSHAADLYKSSLPSLTGLTKVQSERRVKEAAAFEQNQFLLSNSGSGNRPYDVELEYLESNGRTYIDTGIIPDELTGYYIRFFPVEFVDSVVFGMRESSGHTRFYCGVNAEGEYVGIDSLLPFARLPASHNWYEISLNFKGDKKLVKSSTGSPQCVSNLKCTPGKKSYPCWIFAPNVAGSVPSYIGTFRVSSVKMSKANKVVLDAIPVFVGTVGCMYDKISRKLLMAKG